MLKIYKVSCEYGDQIQQAPCAEDAIEWVARYMAAQEISQNDGDIEDLTTEFISEMTADEIEMDGAELENSQRWENRHMNTSGF